MIKRSLLYLLLLAFVLAGCGSGEHKTSAKTILLKEVFGNDFLIGAAVSREQLAQKDRVGAGLLPHFNALTPENIMKSERLMSAWQTYHFSAADSLVAYCQNNNIILNGHTLIWHSQMPPFIEQIRSIDSFRTFFTSHIKTVAGRYAGKLQSWDVVNEALNEDGSLRQSVYYQKLGENYISEAFRLAEQADPHAELYYNDYNNEMPAKRAGCIKLIKKMQAEGIKINGVGIQGHWHVGKLPLKEIEESILEYAALGIKLAITELDIEVLPRNFTGAEISQRMKADPATNPYVGSLPDSVKQQQAKDYADLFSLFLKHKDKISRVTFWGVHDGQSWLNDWPVPGRTNHPLLFDRDGKPKPAFYSILTTKP